MDRVAFRGFALLIVFGCAGSTTSDKAGGSSGGSSGGGVGNEGGMPGGSSNGGSVSGGTSSGGTATGGTSCSCGGCGGPPLCCGADGAVTTADFCNHACPPGMTPGFPLCGGECLSNSYCKEDEFCHSTYACSKPGMCIKRPASCQPADSGPAVCGCDGAQYASACHANAAGTDVDPSGSCP